MEKTINCAECNALVTYNEISGYPRKYCKECSAKKKAEFEGKTTGDIDPEHMDMNATYKDVNPKVVNMVGVSPEVHKDFEMIRGKKDNGFHLTPEQVRSNALASAIEYMGEAPTKEHVIELAKNFEQYILTGE